MIATLLSLPAMPVHEPELLPSLRANSILRALSMDDLAFLAPLLKPVSLPLRHVFSEPGATIRDCFFMTSGMTSMVAVLKDGSSAEVGVIGAEGLVGFSAILGVNTAQHLTITQIAGDGLRIDANKLRDVCDERPGIRRGIDRFIWSCLALAAQCAVCNRFHSLEERTSRWLLTVRDRIQSDTLPITHEFLGAMLGAHRSTVTLALGTLESSGVIRNLRGRIVLLDPQKLERTSCECLEVIRKLPSYGIETGAPLKDGSFVVALTDEPI